MTCTSFFEEVSRADRQRRTAASRERHAELLAEFERSPLSARAFAELARVRHSTFADWVQRHPSETSPLASAAPPKPTPVCSVEAVVDRAAQTPQAEQPMVVKLGAEMVVEVSCGAHVELAGLLARPRGLWLPEHLPVVGGDAGA